MRSYSLYIFLFLTLSCEAPKKGIDLQPRDIIPLNLMDVSKNYDPIHTKITITAEQNDLFDLLKENQHLKKENHLLRVEIDNLKEKIKILKITLELKADVEKMKKSVCID